MSKKEKRENAANNLPLDCWSHIILFIDEPKTFFSLLLVVKGLWQYIQRVNPGCTRNICFMLKESTKFPNKEAFHVTSFKYLMNAQFFEGYFRKELECGESGLMGRILQKFPNLERLDMELLKYMGFVFQELALEDMETFVFDKSILMTRMLKELKITLSVCDLEIKTVFPRVKKLQLIRFGYAFDSYQGMDTDGFERISDLEVEFGKSFPKLKDLVLCGWNLESNALQNLEVESMTLDSVEIENSTFLLSDMPDLKELAIGYTTLNMLSGLKNLPSLEKLSLSSDTIVSKNLSLSSGTKVSKSHEWFQYNEVSRDHIRSSFTIHSLPSLKHIDIFHADFEFSSGCDGKPVDWVADSRRSVHYKEKIHGVNEKTNKNGYMIISDLPNLESIRVDDVDFEVELVNTPNVQSFFCDNSHGTKIVRARESRLGEPHGTHYTFGKMKSLDFRSYCSYKNSSVDFFYSFVPCLSKTLEEVSIASDAIYEDYEYVVEEESDYFPVGRKIWSISLTDFPLLSKVSWKGYGFSGFLNEISLCPNLVSLELTDLHNDFKLGDLPSLKKISLHNVMKCRSVAKTIFPQLKNAPNLESFMVEFRRDVLHAEGIGTFSFGHLVGLKNFKRFVLKTIGPYKKKFQMIPLVLDGEGFQFSDLSISLSIFYTRDDEVSICNFEELRGIDFRGVVNATNITDDDSPPGHSNFRLKNVKVLDNVSFEAKFRELWDKQNDKLFIHTLQFNFEGRFQCLGFLNLSGNYFTQNYFAVERIFDFQKIMKIRKLSIKLEKVEAEYKKAAVAPKNHLIVVDGSVFPQLEILKIVDDRWDSNVRTSESGESIVKLKDLKELKSIVVKEHEHSKEFRLLFKEFENIDVDGIEIQSSHVCSWGDPLRVYLDYFKEKKNKVVNII